MKLSVTFFLTEQMGLYFEIFIEKYLFYFKKQIQLLSNEAGFCNTFTLQELLRYQ